MGPIEVLQQLSPDEWHQAAWQWNWDGGLEVLRWIIQQPICDRGTALLVYWYGGPRYMAQYTAQDEVPTYQRENYDLIMDIAARYTTGSYTRQEIAFDPRNDEGFDWTKEYKDIPLRRELPAIMLEASPGRKVVRQEGWDEGWFGNEEGGERPST